MEKRWESSHKGFLSWAKKAEFISKIMRNHYKRLGKAGSYQPYASKFTPYNEEEVKGWGNYIWPAIAGIISILI